MNTIAEVRVLVFSLADVKKALGKYASEFDIVVPDKDIHEIVDPARSQSDKIVVHFQHPARNTDEKVEIEPLHMVECLIKLCKEKKIPIPFNATKTLDCSRDSVSLWINFGAPEEVQNAEPFQKLKNKE